MGDILHRLWQGLPYRLRRRALLVATSALSPRLDASACPRPAGPLFIAGFLSAASGLGEMARLLHDAYARERMPVFGIDLSRPFRQGRDVAFSYVDGRQHRGPGTLVLAVNAPFVPLALSLLGRRFLAHKWRIGYWAWELPGLPPDWRGGARRVHEIWAISGFSAQAMERGLGRSVRVVLPPVLAPARAPVRRIGANGEFVVVLAFNMASSFARKNPLAAIAAFKAAFADDPGARLLVTFVHASAYPAGAHRIAEACRGHANIELLDGARTENGLMHLLADADALLSLHRAEGLGLLFAHAMHLGLPIVATGWSGNLEILNSSNAWLVPATLVPARDPQGTYDWPDVPDMQWAEPSVSAAAAILRQLRSHPALREQKCRQALADAHRLFSQPLPFLAA